MQVNFSISVTFPLSFLAISLSFLFSFFVHYKSLKLTQRTLIEIFFYTIARVFRKVNFSLCLFSPISLFESFEAYLQLESWIKIFPLEIYYSTAKGLSQKDEPNLSEFSNFRRIFLFYFSTHCARRKILFSIFFSYTALSLIVPHSSVLVAFNKIDLYPRKWYFVVPACRRFHVSLRRTELQLIKHILVWDTQPTLNISRHGYVIRVSLAIRCSSLHMYHTWRATFFRRWQGTRNGTNNNKTYLKLLNSSHCGLINFD